MKNLFILLGVFLILSCSERNKNQENCVKSLTYKLRRLELLPDLIKINIPRSLGYVDNDSAHLQSVPDRSDMYKVKLIAQFCKLCPQS